MSYNAGTILWWNDPDGDTESNCSQYVVVQEYVGSGTFRCMTAKGSEVECLSTEVRVCNEQETALVRQCIELHDALFRVHNGANHPLDFNFEKHLLGLGSVL